MFSRLNARSLQIAMHKALACLKKKGKTKAFGF